MLGFKRLLMEQCDPCKEIVLLNLIEQSKREKNFRILQKHDYSQN